MRLIALRGATTVPANEAEAILAATQELMNELLARNGLDAADLVSCVFTLTEDLDAEFPAVAARHMGLSRVPLLCASWTPTLKSSGTLTRSTFRESPGDETSLGLRASDFPGFASS